MNSPNDSFVSIASAPPPTIPSAKTIGPIQIDALPTTGSCDENTTGMLNARCGCPQREIDLMSGPLEPSQSSTESVPAPTPPDPADHWEESAAAAFHAYIQTLDRNGVLEIDVIEDIIQAAREICGADGKRLAEGHPFTAEVFATIRTLVADARSAAMKDEEPTLGELRAALLRIFENHEREWEALLTKVKSDRALFTESLEIAKSSLGKSTRTSGWRAARAAATQTDQWLEVWAVAQVKRCAKILGEIDQDANGLKASLRNGGCPKDLVDTYFQGARTAAGRLAYRYAPAPDGPHRPLKKFFRVYAILRKCFESGFEKLRKIAISKGVPAREEGKTLESFLNVDARFDVENGATSFDPDGRKPRPWINTVVRNCARRWHRKNRPLGNSISTVTYDENLHDVEDSGATLVSDEDLEVLKEAFSTLGDDDAEIINQHAREGVPFPALAIEQLLREAPASLSSKAIITRAATLRQAYGRAREKLKALIDHIVMLDTAKGTEEVAAAMFELCDSDRRDVESAGMDNPARRRRSNAILRLVAHVKLRRLTETFWGKKELREAVKFPSKTGGILAFQPVDRRTPQRVRQSRTGVTKNLIETLATFKTVIDWRLNKRPAPNEEAMLAFLSSDCRDAIGRYWNPKDENPLALSLGELVRQQQLLDFEKTIEYRVRFCRNELAPEECPLGEIDARYRPFFQAVIFEGCSYDEAVHRIATQAAVGEAAEQDEDEEDNEFNSSEILAELLRWDKQLELPPERRR